MSKPFQTDSIFLKKFVHPRVHIFELVTFLPFFHHLSFFFSLSLSRANRVATRRKEGSFGEKDRTKGEFENDARDGFNPIVQEQKISKRT